MLSPRVATSDRRTALPAIKTVMPFYQSPEWRGLMDRIIALRGRKCEDPLCKTPGRAGMRLFGDHVHELKDGGAPLDEANIMLRCGSCHTRKTLEERAKRLAAKV